MRNYTSMLMSQTSSCWSLCSSRSSLSCSSSLSLCLLSSLLFLSSSQLLSSFCTAACSSETPHTNRWRASHDSWIFSRTHSWSTDSTEHTHQLYSLQMLWCTADQKDTRRAKLQKYHYLNRWFISFQINLTDIKLLNSSDFSRSFLNSNISWTLINSPYKLSWGDRNECVRGTGSLRSWRVIFSGWGDDDSEELEMTSCSLGGLWNQNRITVEISTF